MTKRTSSKQMMTSSTQVDIDASGSRLLTGSYSTNASVWSLHNHRRLAEFKLHDAEIVAVDLHPNGRRAATLDAQGMLHVWDTANGTPIFSIDPESDQFGEPPCRGRRRITNERSQFSIRAFHGDLHSGRLADRCLSARFDESV